MKKFTFSYYKGVKKIAQYKYISLHDVGEFTGHTYIYVYDFIVVD